MPRKPKTPRQSPGKGPGSDGSPTPTISARPEALFTMTANGPVLTDAGKADAQHALREYLASCGIPEAEWPGIIARAIDRGGSNADVEREVGQWLSEHGRALVSATWGQLSPETQERIRRRYGKSTDAKVNAHLDRLERQAIPPTAPMLPASDGKADEPPIIALDAEDEKILAGMARNPHRLFALVDLPGSNKTTGQRVNAMIARGLACRPNGPKAGVQITPQGLTLAEKAGLLPRK